MTEIRIGTSAFTAEGWEGTFYPKGIQPREQLSYYATQFDTVELDNTFYRTPALSTVKGFQELQALQHRLNPSLTQQVRVAKRAVLREPPLSNRTGTISHYSHRFQYSQTAQTVPRLSKNGQISPL
jgi:Protein of unknown function DUF72